MTPQIFQRLDLADSVSSRRSTFLGAGEPLAAIRLPESEDSLIKISFGDFPARHAVVE
jgi:hypothetical protein